MLNNFQIYLFIHIVYLYLKLAPRKKIYYLVSSIFLFKIIISVSIFIDNILKN